MITLYHAYVFTDLVNYQPVKKLWLYTCQWRKKRIFKNDSYILGCYCYKCSKYIHKDKIHLPYPDYNKLLIGGSK
uniref:Uncharacterized protein n=1 Tax=viral metagenome TaxID=1070528 RepID=A0A6M3IX29_9ZZZZ